jgi:hypothetical protein
VEEVEEGEDLCAQRRCEGRKRNGRRYLEAGTTTILFWPLAAGE